MKNCFILIIIILLTSCNHKAEKKTKIAIKASKNLTLEEKCFADSCRAVKDIKNGKLKYFFFIGMTEMYNSNKEMKQLLAKYNIEIDSALTYCTDARGQMNCYPGVMYREINKRYGIKFIDSLRNVANILFVKNNPERIFTYEECDTISRYPKDKSYKVFVRSEGTNYEKDFFKSTPFPKGFKYREGKEYCSSLSAEFNLFKNGEISDLEVETTFQNKLNSKFETYYNNKLIEFIKKTKWIPAKSKGITVNSKVELTLFFENDKPLLVRAPRS